MLEWSSSSRHFGTARKTALRQTAMASGLPGRLMIRLAPRVPAVWRERMAVGTVCRLTVRICWAKPSKMRSQMAWVASGVTSRVVGPVPPVVRMRLQCLLSAKSIIVCSIKGCSSSIIMWVIE